jgi:serine/alanine adding enzyme
MGFLVLTPHGADVAKWEAVLDILPPKLRDIHFTPQYSAAQELLGLEARLAVYEWEGYVVAQPFALRHVEVGNTNAMDISSLYGYGGPVSNHGPQLYAWFDEAFREWCQQKGVVSEFCALHPLIWSHQASLLWAKGFRIELRKPIVLMDLRSDFEAEYKDRRIAGIKAALKAGVKVTIEPCTKDFAHLYRTTMARTDAAPRWDFPDAYFDALIEMGAVFLAKIGDHVESAALMIYGYGTAYYHFAGNAMENPKACANDLLVHEMALFARKQGPRWFHLGGGATSSLDDGVFHYKAGFSDRRAQALSYFRVFDDRAYRDLCLAKIGEEVAMTGAEFKSEFLPLYRREVS